MFVLVLYDCMQGFCCHFILVISSVLLCQLHRGSGEGEDGAKALYYSQSDSVLSQTVLVRCLKYCEIIGLKKDSVRQEDGKSTVQGSDECWTVINAGMSSLMISASPSISGLFTTAGRSQCLHHPYCLLFSIGWSLSFFFFFLKGKYDKHFF